ncbi:MAG TPA: winged helix DNA-binding domain-containing protein [Mycobacterium sp.]
MRSFTVDERRARLARRHLLTTEPGAASIADIASQLVGLHATDPTTPFLSLWARLPGFQVADLEAALYRDRAVVKHLAMRRTLWVLTAGDLAAVQTAASDRVATNERKHLIADVQKSGIADDGERWLGRASKAVLAHVTKHGPTGARELREALPELAGNHDPAPGKPWGGATPVAPRVLTVLAVEGSLVRGPNDGAWTTARPRWTSASAWLGEAGDPAAADAARSAVVLAWLRAFGPATVNDLKWWFGSTLTWARDGLRDVGAVEVDLHGTPGYALADDLEPEPDTESWCALLPGLDVTTMGWQARDWYLGEHGSQVFDNRGNAGPTAWVDGRIVGAWRQDDDGRVVPILIENVGAKASKALARKADELTEWLNGVRINPRFPSPLSKA